MRSFHLHDTGINTVAQHGTHSLVNLSFRPPASAPPKPPILAVLAVLGAIRMPRRSLAFILFLEGQVSGWSNYLGKVRTSDIQDPRSCVHDAPSSTVGVMISVIRADL